MTDILIVDDERDIRELISEILIDEGYQTRLCGGADDCLQELKKSVPGLLILDIWLKDNEMDGIDILVKAKREFPQVPVVIISGHGISRLPSLRLSKVLMTLLRNRSI